MIIMEATKIEPDGCKHPQVQDADDPLSLVRCPDCKVMVHGSLED